MADIDDFVEDGAAGERLDGLADEVGGAGSAVVIFVVLRHGCALALIWRGFER
jgi:hypothetical protein